MSDEAARRHERWVLTRVAARERAREALAHAEAEVKKAKARVVLLRERLAALEAPPEVRAPTSAAALRASVVHRDATRQRKRALEREIAEAERAVAEALAHEARAKEGLARAERELEKAEEALAEVKKKARLAREARLEEEALDERRR